MTGEEIRVRSLYLYVACSYAAVKLQAHVIEEIRRLKMSFDRKQEEQIFKEVGILFRFWVTRQIWENLVQEEADAKSLNFATFDLFNKGFKLPNDESHVRYGEISGRVEEVKEFGLRVCGILNQKDPELLLMLSTMTSEHWFPVILQYTKDAVEQPFEQARRFVDEMAAADKQTPSSGGSG